METARIRTDVPVSELPAAAKAEIQKAERALRAHDYSAFSAAALRFDALYDGGFAVIEGRAHG